MKTKTKTFDCVEMKRLGSQRIYEKIKDMTFEQKVAYWRQRSRQFREQQGELIAAYDRRSGDPGFPDNQPIDADPAKEYGNHDERGRRR